MSISSCKRTGKYFKERGVYSAGTNKTEGKLFNVQAIKSVNASLSCQCDIICSTFNYFHKPIISFRLRQGFQRKVY